MVGGLHSFVPCMVNQAPKPTAARPRHSGSDSTSGQLSIEHYLRLVNYRKWWVLTVFSLVSAATALVSYRLPNVYSSETVILVDPQKVPESYVKSTVTGDVRNRLGTLSQQILSATRLQTIIERLNLYPAERKTLAREDIILRMRADIGVTVLSDFGGSQDLQAFRIVYSGKDPRLVAQVTNQLASLFIDENLKAREQQATGTTEFLQNQLVETRKALEEQESKLRDFKLKHIGEMPEQQTADLQILGQLQAQLQSESDTLVRAEQQKSYLQSMLSQSAPVIDLDDGEQKGPPGTRSLTSGSTNQGISAARAKLASLRTVYTDKYPAVVKLKQQIADEEERLAALSRAGSEVPQRQAEAKPAVADQVKPPSDYYNPVVQSQIKMLDAEIIKHKEEKDRIAKSAAGYQAKLDIIPVREQEITQLVRDYEMSKAHYSQLLEKQLSAETATQLEIRQKGEKFEILDPAQVPQRPSRPNRRLINAAGSLSGLVLGLLVALATELLGISITAPQDITAACGFSCA